MSLDDTTFNHVPLERDTWAVQVREMPPPRTAATPQTPSSLASVEEDDLEALQDFLSDATLLEISACDSLEEIRSLEMRIDTTEMSMGDLGSRLPSLTQLKLNHSQISSTRDLGTGFRNLRVLWISQCGLYALDGLTALVSLQELYAAFNDVQDLSPLTSCSMLRVIDLECNQVKDLEEVSCLMGCDQLSMLTLEANPVAFLPNYRRQVLEVLPRLLCLDDKTVGEESLGDSVDADDAEMAAMRAEAAQLSQDVELELVHNGIKYARSGIDDASFIGIQEELQALEYGTLPSARSRPGSSRNRPKSAAIQRPGSSHRRAAMTAASGRPATAMTVGGSAVVGFKTEQLTHALKAINASRSDETSSSLTFGNEEIFCGNVSKALRRQSSRPGSGEGEVKKKKDELSMEGVLAELRAWKMETATLALTADPLETEVGSNVSERLVIADGDDDDVEYLYSAAQGTRLGQSDDDLDNDDDDDLGLSSGRRTSTERKPLPARPPRPTSSASSTSSPPLPSTTTPTSSSSADPFFTTAAAAAATTTAPPSLHNPIAMHTTRPARTTPPVAAAAAAVLPPQPVLFRRPVPAIPHTPSEAARPAPVLNGRPIPAIPLGSGRREKREGAAAAAAVVVVDGGGGEEDLAHDGGARAPSSSASRERLTTTM